MSFLPSVQYQLLEISFVIMSFDSYLAYVFLCTSRCLRRLLCVQQVTVIFHCAQKATSPCLCRRFSALSYCEHMLSKNLKVGDDREGVFVVVMATCLNTVASTETTCGTRI